MDPNQALADLRKIMRAIAEAGDNTDSFVDDHQAAAGVALLAVRAEELFSGLDQWMSKGGAAPDAWPTAPVPPRGVPLRAGGGPGTLCSYCGAPRHPMTPGTRCGSAVL